MTTTYEPTLINLMHALAQLDPQSRFTFQIYVKSPAGPPQLFATSKESSKNYRTRFHSNFTAEQLAKIRKLAAETPMSKIAAEYQVHRSTISRYIKSEFEAGRMGVSGRGFKELPGKYDLQTKLPVKS